MNRVKAQIENVRSGARLMDVTNIPRGILNILGHHGIETMGDLLTSSVLDLVRMDGIGIKALCKIEDALYEQGFCLRFSECRHCSKRILTRERAE